MKTVYRQDGSAVELPDEEAANWVKRKIATYENPSAPKVTPIKSTQGATK